MNTFRKNLHIITFLLSLFNAMWYFSMYTQWSGINGMFGFWPLFLILFGILIAMAVVTFILAFYRKAVLALFILSVVFSGALGYMLFLARENYPYFINEFFKLAAALAFITAVCALLLKFPFKNKYLNAAKLPAVIIIAFIALAVFYKMPVRAGIKTGPVVYAVGDKYQIVFTTRSNSMGWVDIGNERFVNLYAGSADIGKVHKIEVPMSLLDTRREYTINAQTMFYAGPYDGIRGRTFTRRVSFSPVPDSGDLQFYAVSDAHHFVRFAASAASWWGDDLDFLVMLGDISSFFVAQSDLDRTIRIASTVTKGRVPVVYARGNHEVKGRYAEDLHNYAGADGSRFYYTFRIGPVWGIVLDMGENHDDDWWEFYGTAFFADYRREQTAFLRSINENAANEYNAPGITTRLALFHIPISYSSANDFLRDTKTGWVNELNKMNLDLSLSGHTHRLFYITPEILPGTQMTRSDGSTLGIALNLNAPSIIVSNPTDFQHMGNRVPGGGQTGLAVEMTRDKIFLTYTNSKGKALDFSDPFTGEELMLPLVFDRRQ